MPRSTWCISSPTPIGPTATRSSSAARRGAIASASPWRTIRSWSIFTVRPTWRASGGRFKAHKISRIEVLGQGGDDEIRIEPEVTVPAVVLCGGGNNHVRTGGGPTVVVGGPGNDEIEGGNGRNVLIGGLGRDHIKAGTAATFSSPAGPITTPTWRPCGRFSPSGRGPMPVMPTGSPI